MVQKIHPQGAIWDPNFAPYVERFQILELLSKCSILEPSLLRCSAFFLHLLSIPCWKQPKFKPK